MNILTKLLGITAVLILAAACDCWDLFEFGPSRYLLAGTATSIAVLCVRLEGLKLNRPHWSTWAFLILSLIAIPGITYNKLVGSSPSLFTATSLSIVVWCAQLLPIEKLKFNPGRLLTLIGCIGYCNLLVVCYLLLTHNPDTYNRDALMTHARSFLIPLAFCVACLRRQYIAAALAAILVSVMVRYDPRTTAMLAIVIALAIFTCAVIPTALRIPLLIASCIVLTGGYNLVRSVNTSFKENMGETDNADFREDKWQMAIREFQESPWIGKCFTGCGDYDHPWGHRIVDDYGTQLDADTAPLHNDYLEFLVDGGITGMGLFVLGLTGTLWLGIKNYAILKRHQLHEHAALALIALIALTIAMMAMACNPIINHPTGVFVYLFVALIILIDRDSVYAIPQP